MFDIGFWELMVIGVLGLVVLGPERLPVAIRTVRSWIASARSFSQSVKTELSEELRIHELHSNLKKAEESNLENLSPEISESLRSLKEAAEMVNRPYQTSTNEVKETEPTNTAESEEVNQINEDKIP
ncbi:MAG: Sec-independent protein translocase subunit TatB [Alteromonadaceae bacterium]|nr:Sec-independent protein translocase subunit TatB [Alteromonadaceae bacterium]